MPKTVIEAKNPIYPDWESMRMVVGPGEWKLGTVHMSIPGCSMDVWPEDAERFAAALIEQAAIARAITGRGDDHRRRD